VLVQHTTSTKSDKPQSRLALSLRRSLRNLTPWKSAHTIGKVFQRRWTTSKSLPAKDSKDWVDDFHLVTPEDIESESHPSIRSLGHWHTISAHTETSAKHHPTLPPLLIPDSKITCVSTYTLNSPQKTITTDSSPTPTLTEVAHITSSFPQPPRHLPITIPFPSTTTSAFTLKSFQH